MKACSFSYSRSCYQTYMTPSASSPVHHAKAEIVHSPAMITGLSLFTAIAYGLSGTTNRYAGINSADPMRNMERCENFPLGGL